MKTSASITNKEVSKTRKHKDNNIATNNYKNNLSIKIDNDLTAYFSFLTILSKKRSAVNTKLIEQHIKEEPDTLKRIAFIEDIDKKEKLAQEVEKETSHKPTNEIGKIAFKKIEKVNLFRYFFLTKNRIKSFGMRTKTIEFNIFLANRISNDANRYYEQLLLDIEYNLISPIDYIVKHSWQYLDVDKYNIIVALQKTIKRMLQAHNILKSNSINLIYKNMQSFIHQYLYLISEQEHIHSIQKTVYETLITIPQFKKVLNRSIALTKEILDIKSKTLSLFNIILAIIIIKYRTIPKLQDVLRHYKITRINNKHYDLNHKIILSIKHELQQSTKTYIDAEQELFTIQFIDKNLSMQSKIDKAQYIYLIFARVYTANSLQEFNSIKEMVNNKEASINFLSHLKEDLPSTVLKFVRGFTKIYFNFLNGTELTLETSKGQIIRKQIFAHWIFDDILEELKDYEADLMSFKANNPFMVIKFVTYEQYLSQGKLELIKENKICNLISQTVALLYAIANKVSLLLYGHFMKAHSLTDKEKVLLYSAQNTKIKDLDNSARFIPYATHKVKNNPYITDLTVIEVLNEINIFALNYCNLLNHPPLLTRKTDEMKHIQKVEHFLKIKSKVPQIKIRS